MELLQACPAYDQANVGEVITLDALFEKARQSGPFPLT